MCTNLYNNAIPGVTGPYLAYDHGNNADADRRLPVRVVLRSPASPSTGARATRRPSTTPCSSPTTPASACGRCSRRPTAIPTRPTSLASATSPTRCRSSRGPAAYNDDLFYVDMDGGNIHRALLRPRQPAADRGREGDADERADPAHGLLRRHRLDRPAEPKRWPTAGTSVTAQRRRRQPERTPTRTPAATPRS